MAEREAIHSDQLKVERGTGSPAKYHTFKSSLKLRLQLGLSLRCVCVCVGGWVGVGVCVCLP